MPSPALVQSAATSFTNTNLPFPGNVAAGNLLVAAVGIGGNGPGASVTDSQDSVPWSRAFFYNGTEPLWFWYKIASQSGPCTVTLNLGTSAYSMGIAEILLGSMILDGVPTGVYNATSPGTLTTTLANSIVVVGLVTVGVGFAANWTYPAGWAGAQDTGNVFLNNHNATGIAVHVQTTAGAVNPTFTGSDIVGNGQAIIAFQTVPAAPGPAFGNSAY